MGTVCRVRDLQFYQTLAVMVMLPNPTTFVESFTGTRSLRT
ncbi:MAG: hypothetical protein ACFCD0_14675 [Gemmataceae bacterium]